MSEPTPSFAERYGAWAIIAGGSDGLGAAIAHEIAARGVNCVLVARRQGPLDALAADLAAKHGVEARTLSLDLGTDDAVARLMAETGDIDVGLVVFNAGAEDSGAYFDEAPWSAWRNFLQRNVIFLTEGLHSFAGRLRARGSGGLLVVGSEAAFGGGGRGAMYTASKGYALNLCESLWAELKPRGVDVQTLIFKIADTPTLRTVLARKGIPIEVTGAVSVETLARATVAAIGDGPMFNFDEESPDDPLTSNTLRRQRVLSVTEKLQHFYGAG